jgi:hypothetical protein
LVVMETCLQSLPSNRHLFWTHNSGFEPPCHNIKKNHCSISFWTLRMKKVFHKIRFSDTFGLTSHNFSHDLWHWLYLQFCFPS